MLCFSFLRCKESYIINGMTGKIKYMKGTTIFIEDSNKFIPVFVVYEGHK